MLNQGEIQTYLGRYNDHGVNEGFYAIGVFVGIASAGLPYSKISSIFFSGACFILFILCA